MLPTSRGFVTQLLNSLRTLPRTSAHATNAATTNPLVDASEPVKKQLLALHVLFPNELLPALDLLDRRLVTRFCIRRGRGQRLGETAPPTHLAATLASTAALHNHEPNVENEVLQSDDDGTRGASKASVNDTVLTHAVGEIDSPDTEMVDVTHTEIESVVTHEIGHEPPNAEESSKDAVEQDTIYYVRSAQQRASRFNTSFDTTTSYEVRLKAWNCSCPAFSFSAFPSIHPEQPVPVYDPAEPDSTSYASDSETTGQETWSFGGMDSGDGAAPVCKHLLACVLVDRCPALFGDFVEERDVSVEEAAGWAAGWGD